MARPKKAGLDYFPFDVDLFDDEKVRAVSGEFGIKGEITLVKLLCAIYRNGYFILWDEPARMRLLASLPGISPELLDRIVNRLVLWDAFDKGLFDTARVLTSRAIQRRYFAAITRRKASTESWPYLLVGTGAGEALNEASNEALKIVSACNNPVSACNNRVSARKSTQRKDKQSLSYSFKESIEEDVGGARAGVPAPAGWLPVGELVEELLSDGGWLRAVAMCAHGSCGRELSPQELEAYVRRYGCKLLADGETRKDPRQARYHFNNWLRIVLGEEKRKEERRHERTTTFGRAATKREANAEVLRGLAESYRAEWQGGGVDGAVEKPY